MADKANTPNGDTSSAKGDRALGILGLGAASLSMLVVGFSHGSPVPITAGAILGASTFGIARREKLTWAEVPPALGLISDGLDTAWETSIGDIKSSSEVMLNFIPEAYKPSLQKLVSKLIEEDWLPSMLRQSKMVVGQTGAGKTPLLLHEVFSFIKSCKGRGRLIICDINYGKRTVDGKPNNWLGLPKDRFIRTDTNGVFDAIQESWEELQRRKLKCQQAADAGRETVPSFAPWHLIIDEGLVTFDRMEAIGSIYDEAIAMLGDLLFEGRAYDVTFTIAVQTPFANESGFGRGKMQQMNYMILGDSATDTEVLSKIPGIGKRSAELIEQVEAIRKQPGGKYAAIVKQCGKSPAFSIKVVPTLDVAKYKITISEQAKRPWIDTVAAEHGDRLRELAQQFASGEIQSPWKGEVLPLAKLNANAKQRDPERYEALKSYWDALVQECSPQTAKTV